MEQSKLESRIETILNNGSGFIISLGLWAFIVNPLIKLNYISIDDSFSITSIFFIVSMLRSYSWRRFFATGVHKIVHTWVAQSIHIKW